MKYMLMMNTPTGGAYKIFDWPRPAIQAHIDFMIAFAKKLREAGEHSRRELVELIEKTKVARLIRQSRNECPL